MSKATGRFTQEDRLLRGAEFRYVARCGRRARVGSLLVMAAVRKGQDEVQRVRLGIVAGRHVGNAVVRNRHKRWIREWFRERRSMMRSGLDVVVIVQRGAAASSHGDVVGALEAGIRAVGSIA